MKYLLSVLLAFTPFLVMSQEPEMADALYVSGKIYVVVIVLAIIMAGLFGFMIYLDRKLSKLEKTTGQS